MLLLVSKWKCLLLMFLLSSLRSMQSLSLPPFFPTVFKASAQAAGSLILQIMPSAVTFYSSATGLFCPQKMSQHLWQILHLPVFPSTHQWVCAPWARQSTGGPVATSMVTLSDWELACYCKLLLQLVIFPGSCFHRAGTCFLTGTHAVTFSLSVQRLIGVFPLQKFSC